MCIVKTDSIVGLTCPACKLCLCVQRAWFLAVTLSHNQRWVSEPSHLIPPGTKKKDKKVKVQMPTSKAHLRLLNSWHNSKGEEHVFFRSILLCSCRILNSAQDSPQAAGKAKEQTASMTRRQFDKGGLKVKFSHNTLPV